MIVMVRPVHPSVGGNQAQEEKFNFAYSFRPVYYISRLFGLMSFSIIYDENGEVQKCAVTKFDAIWFVISLSMYFLMGFLLQHYAISTAAFAMGNIFGLLNFVFSFFAIVINMCNRCKVIEILKNITIFDEEVRLLNILTIFTYTLININ